MGIGMTMLLPSSSAPHASPYRLAYRTPTDRAERLGAGSLFAMNAVCFYRAVQLLDRCINNKAIWILF
jgi:hypothetical protein